jgi:hypothetical protein
VTPNPTRGLMGGFKVAARRYIGRLQTTLDLGLALREVLRGPVLVAAATDAPNLILSCKTARYCVDFHAFATLLDEPD